jgi:hypothetical protein
MERRLSRSDPCDSPIIMVNVFDVAHGMGVAKKPGIFTAEKW